MIGIGKMKPDDPRYNRRLKFSLIIIVSQMLLIALAVAWGIYLMLISQNGGTIISTETNKWILLGEIVTAGLIIVFAFIVVSMELKRLLAKRHSDQPDDRRSFSDNNNKK